MTLQYKRVVSLFSILLLVALVEPQVTFAQMQFSGIGGHLELSGFEDIVSGIISNTSAEASSGSVTSGASEETGDAEAHVRTTVRGGGSNVRIDVRTAVDGIEQATSVERVVPEGRLFEIRVDASSERPSVRISESLRAADATSSEEVSTTSASWIVSIIARFESAVTGMFQRLFSSW